MLRTEVFAEAFSDADPTAVIHPWLMVSRAFRVYGERPLLGEPRGDGSVQWWSYASCDTAARGTWL